MGARASKEVDEALRLFSFSLSLLLLFVMKSACVFVVVLLSCVMVGTNEAQVEMTVPVLASVQPGQGPFCKENFTYHFYLPREFQKDPPKPTDPRVTNVEVDALNVAVLSYPGWSNENKVISHGKELFEFLKQDNVTYTSENYFTAGYDSPFRLTDRHNEVWVQVQQIA